MKVALTGTPGTGKTSATNELATDLETIHLNEIITEEDLYTEIDEERNSLVADVDAIRSRFADKDNILVESHLAHYIDADIVIVLRCHPETLEERLMARGESQEKAAENAESEALDGILIEAVDIHGPESVYEIQTTSRTPGETAAEINEILEGNRSPEPGRVDYTNYL